jgi:hypothetical protein
MHTNVPPEMAPPSQRGVGTPSRATTTPSGATTSAANRTAALGPVLGNGAGPVTTSPFDR